MFIHVYACIATDKIEEEGDGEGERECTKFNLKIGLIIIVMKNRKS